MCRETCPDRRTGHTIRLVSGTGQHRYGFLGVLFLRGCELAAVANIVHEAEYTLADDFLVNGHVGLELSNLLLKSLNLDISSVISLFRGVRSSAGCLPLAALLLANFDKLIVLRLLVGLGLLGLLVCRLRVVTLTGRVLVLLVCRIVCRLADATAALAALAFSCAAATAAWAACRFVCAVASASVAALSSARAVLSSPAAAFLAASSALRSTPVPETAASSAACAWLNFCWALSRAVVAAARAAAVSCFLAWAVVKAARYSAFPAGRWPRQPWPGPDWPVQ